MSRKKGDILLIGSYGRGNLGDDAFLLAALKLFKGHRLFINSSNDELLPKAVQGNVSTIATSGNRDIMQKIKMFRQIDHIVYCGGDLWVELYGDKYPRQSLYKMVVVNLIARLFGKKVHYVGCGIGKITGYSLFLARLSARLAQGIIVREPRSARVLNLKKVRVLPDLVTNLDIPTARKRQKGKYTIGVSILYYLPDPEKNFPRLIKNLSKSLGRLSADHYRVVLFPMLNSPADDHDDVWASEQLQAALPGLEVTMFTGREVDEYVAALREVDVLIGTRLHANIIALMAGVPTLGISYRTKVAQFFEMSKLGDYCIDLDDVTPELLSAKLQEMQDDHKTVMGRISEARNQNIEERKGYQNFVATYL